MKASVNTVLISSLLPLFSQSSPVNHIEKRQLSPLITYHSTNVTSVNATVTKSGTGNVAPGYLFFGNEYNGANPLIMTDEGDLIWSAPSDFSGSDLHVQELNGEKVLTIFSVQAANYEKGFLYGATKILDNTYTQLYEVCPKLPVKTASETPECNADAHEQRITAQGTLLVTAYNTIRADLTSLGGPKKGWLAESQFYELSIPSADILYSWKSLDHVPLNATKLSLMDAGYDEENPFDYFHINSVQKVGSNYLINGRHVWASYMIDSKDGSIIWEFNGYNGGDFGPLPSAPTGETGELFAWQHDATLHHVEEDTVVLTMFNNDNYDQYDAPNPSTGFSFRLDLKTNTSTLLRDSRDKKNPVHSGQEGSYQTLSNGNALIGYGNAPVIQEFGISAIEPILSFQYGAGPTGGSYRAYKMDWVGMPTTDPAVAIDRNSSKGYVSWNGATEVTNWVVRSGHKRHLAQSKNVPRTGFETTFDLPAASAKGDYLQLVGYNGDQELGKSAVMQYKG